MIAGQSKDGSKIDAMQQNKSSQMTGVFDHGFAHEVDYSKQQQSKRVQKQVLMEELMRKEMEAAYGDMNRDEASQVIRSDSPNKSQVSKAKSKKSKAADEMEMEML